MCGGTLPLAMVGLFLQSEVHLMSRLHSLSNEDTRGLLVKYFDKVISLKEDERKTMVDLSQMQVSLMIIFLLPVLSVTHWWAKCYLILNQDI